MKSLFFYNFFQKLRTETGIELDPQQYQNFLNCYVICKPSDKASLLNLCKAIWLTRRQFLADFERLFEEAYASPDVQLQKAPSEEKDPLQSSQEAGISNSGKEDAAGNDLVSSTAQSPGNSQVPDGAAAGDRTGTIPSGNEWEQVILNIQEEQQVGGVETFSEDRISAKKIGYVFSDAKHYPFNERKLRHAWRRYRGTYIRKQTDRLDIVSTIGDYAKKGVLNDLLFESEKFSSQEIIWLSDHGGNMTPFEEWDNAMFRTTKEHAIFGKISRYYFQCYPNLKRDQQNRETDFDLFKDRGHTKTQSLKELRNRWRKKTLIIVFSEGGAALKRNENDRFMAWHHFYMFVNKKAKMVWFNPVDSTDEYAASDSLFAHSKWSGSSAGNLSLILPMYDLKDNTIRQAIQNL